MADCGINGVKTSDPNNMLLVITAFDSLSIFGPRVS